MKKAVIFFVVAITVFLWKTRLGAWSGFMEINIRAGIMAVVLGLAAAFIGFSLPILQLIFLIVRIPIWVILVSLYIFFGGILALLCLVEISIPFLLGYYIGNILYDKAVPVFWCIIIGIFYLAIWIALGKSLGKLIRNTWNEGAKLIGILPPVTVIDNDINKTVFDLHYWFTGKKPNGI